MDVYDRLLDFDHWAIDELFRISEGLSDAQLDQEFDVGYRTVRATFGHIISNIHFWTALMRGQQPEPEAGLSVTAMREWYEGVFAALASLARQLRDEGRMDETYIDHYDVRKSMSGTILHVVLHNAEHRIEIVHMLARLGVGEVPEVDLGARDYELLNT